MKTRGKFRRKIHHLAHFIIPSSLPLSRFHYNYALGCSGPSCNDLQFNDWSPAVPNSNSNSTLNLTNSHRTWPFSQAQIVPPDQNIHILPDHTHVQSMYTLKVETDLFCAYLGIVDVSFLTEYCALRSHLYCHWPIKHQIMQTKSHRWQH